MSDTTQQPSTTEIMSASTSQEPAGDASRETPEPNTDPEAALLARLCRHGEFDHHDERATTAVRALREQCGFTASPAGIRTASRMCSPGNARREAVNDVLEQAGLRMAECDRVMDAIVEAGAWEVNQEQQRREEQQQPGRGRRGQLGRGNPRGSTSGSNSLEGDAQEGGSHCMPELAKHRPLLALGHWNVVNTAVTEAAMRARREGLFWCQDDARHRHSDDSLRGVKSGKKPGENYHPDGAALMNQLIADIKLTSAWEERHIHSKWPTLQGLDKFSTLDTLDLVDGAQSLAIKQLERWLADRINQANESRNQRAAQDSKHRSEGGLAQQWS